MKASYRFVAVVGMPLLLLAVWRDLSSEGPPTDGNSGGSRQADRSKSGQRADQFPEFIAVSSPASSSGEFPQTPGIPDLPLTPWDLSDREEAVLIADISIARGADWNAVIAESAKRATPGLLKALVTNIELQAGINVLREAAPPPERYYPVARSLFECGGAAIAPLVEFCAQPWAPLKSRVLAAQVLRRFIDSADPALSPADLAQMLSTDEERQAFAQAFSVGAVPAKLEALFPPEPLEPPQIPETWPQ